MHDELIEAIQKAVSANGLVQWTRGQEWAYSDETDSPKGGTMEQYTGECDLASFSNEIAITVWSEEGSLDASMDIVMSLPDLDDGFCAILEGPVGLTAAIVGLIPGGSTLAGFLGLIGAACGVTSG